MSKITIWHNPRCSKSRETLALLRENGVDPEIVTYLTTPPTSAEIRTAATLLGKAPIGMMRTKEKRFAELGLSSKTDPEDLITAMAENPILIERPIVFNGAKAAIGRPPHAVLSIL